MVSSGLLGSMACTRSRVHRTVGCRLQPEPMDLFFKPFQLGVTFANDAMEFVDLTLSILGTNSGFAFVGKGVNHLGFGSVPPELYLGWVDLVCRGYLVNGFVATQGGECYLSFLLRAELPSHGRPPFEVYYTGKGGLMWLCRFGRPLHN